MAQEEGELKDELSEFGKTLIALSEPFPDELIRERVTHRGRGGQEFESEYVSWFDVADWLDARAPEWSSAIRSMQQIGNYAVVIVALTIKGITREGVGTGSAESDTGIKKAEHDALKRAAVKFGVGRELYRKDPEDHGEGEQKGYQGKQQNGSKPRSPLAQGLADLLTPKQLVAVRAIAQVQGLQAEEVCRKEFNCNLEELNRAAASYLIDYLKKRQNGEAPQSKEQAAFEAQKPTSIQEARKRLDALIAVCKRDGNTFYFPHSTGAFKVERNEMGKVCCNCQDFIEGISLNANYRCEHIHAAKEFAAKQQPSGSAA